jgi:threonine synthase
MGLHACKKDETANGIFLETAHPAKFMGVYEGELRKKIIIPEALQKNMGRKKLSLPMSKNFMDFKQWLSHHA